MLRETGLLDLVAPDVTEASAADRERRQPTGPKTARYPVYVLSSVRFSRNAAASNTRRKPFSP